MKLELKHLAPYLPYGLKMISINHFEGDEIPWEKWKLCSLSTDNKDSQFDEWWGDDGDNFRLDSGFKPILRPLSDLTKPLENGKSLDKVFKSEFGFVLPTKQEFFNISVCEWRELEYLFKHHFDVFGLIDKELAIDINTLEK